MAQGFLGGFLSGALLCGVTAAAVSLAVGLPDRLVPGPTPTPTDTVAEPAPVPRSDPTSAVPATRPAAEEPVVQSAAPRIGTGTADSGPSAAVSEPGPLPVVDPAIQPVPDAPGTGSVPEVSADSPVSPQATITAPRFPEEENPPVLEGPIEPSPPDVPAGPEDGAALQPDVPAATASSLPATGQPGAPAPADEDAPAPVAAPTDLAVTVAQPRAPEVRRPGSGGAAIIPGNKGGSLLDRPQAVAVRRAPQGATGDDGEAADGSGADAEARDQTPLQAFSVPVEVAPDSPRMAIVLIHDGVGPMGPPAVRDFPFPVSFAVDTRLPDASAIMKGYRDAGHEVLALVDIPAGTREADVGLALQAALAQVPEAVAVMEGAGDGLQGAREVTDAVARFLAQEGRGLVLLPAGLNTGRALAQKDGVPAASVFRDFDGTTRDGRVMRRFLDQAAFKARQEGAIVMLGRMRPDTISALLLWGLQDRANSLTFVPISNILLNPA